MAEPVDRPPPFCVALSEILDWLILVAILGLLAWAAKEGLTFMPAAGYLQNRGLLVSFEQGALVIGAGALLRWLLVGRALSSALLWGLGASAALCLLSLAHTTDLYATREEVYLLTCGSVLALAAAISLRDSTKTHAFVAGLALITLGEALAGLGQWASGSPTPAYWLSRAFAGIIQTRIYGTVGSPNVLAGFLLLGIGATALLTIALPGWWRLLPASVLTVEVMALFLTYSRGGYVGLAAFLLAGSVCLWPVRRRAWPVLILVLLVAGAVAVRFPAVHLRAQSISPAQEDTTTSRLFIWRTALRAWDGNRRWGTGLGTFNAVYSSYRPQGVLMTYAMIGIPGSAHDDYLQLLVETGIVGVALLAVAVLWGLVRAIRRYARRQPDAQAWVATWAATLIGIGATSVADENLFVVTNLVMLLLFSAAVAAHASLASAPLRFRKRLFVLPLLAVLVGLPPLLPPPMRATTLHDEATRAVKAGRFAEAVDRFQAALAADPLNGVVPAYYADLLADLYLRRTNTSAGPWQTLRGSAEEFYLLAERLSPWDAYPRAKLGVLHRAEGRYIEATDDLRQAIALDPYTPRYRLWLGQILLLADDRAGAVEQLREATRLYPVELLVIEHHEGQGPRYLTDRAQLAEAQRLLQTLVRHAPKS